MKKPFRFWMSSGVAMIVAAVSGGASLASEQRLTSSRLSRFDVNEAVQRIDASAQRHGMHVMACMPQKLDAISGESRLVLVLASSHGGTPVVMEAEGAQPKLLLSVYLQRTDAGGTKVLWHDRAWKDLPEGVPDQVQHDVADLPQLIDEALFA